MRRLARIFLVVVLVAGALGAAIFWFLTAPVTVSASALPSHTPNLDNGKTMFLAGGCASCHAPDKEDKTRLSGRRGAEIAVRHLLFPEHLIGS